MGDAGTMSTTQPDLSYDSGHNHIIPAVVAIAISVVAAVIAILLSGMPH
jgi:hypothetical protein